MYEWFLWGKNNSLFDLYGGRLYKLGFGCEFRGVHGSVIEDSVCLWYDTASLGSWFPSVSKQYWELITQWCGVRSQKSWVLYVLFAQGKHNLLPVEICTKCNHWVYSHGQFSLLKHTPNCQNSSEFWLVHCLVIAIVMLHARNPKGLHLSLLDMLCIYIWKRGFETIYYCRYF
jgi:hypothetical protein